MAESHQVGPPPAAGEGREPGRGAPRRRGEAGARRGGSRSAERGQRRWSSPRNPGGRAEGGGAPGRAMEPLKLNTSVPGSGPGPATHLCRPGVLLNSSGPGNLSCESPRLRGAGTRGGYRSEPCMSPFSPNHTRVADGPPHADPLQQPHRPYTALFYTSQLPPPRQSPLHALGP